MSTETPYTSLKTTTLSFPTINYIPNPYACKDILNSRFQICNPSAEIHIAVTKATLDRLLPKD